MVMALSVLPNGTPTNELTKLKCITEIRKILVYLDLNNYSMHTSLDSIIGGDKVGDVTGIIGAFYNLLSLESDVESTSTVLKVTEITLVDKLSWQAWSTHRNTQLKYMDIDSFPLTNRLTSCSFFSINWFGETVLTMHWAVTSAKTLLAIHLMLLMEFPS